MSRFLASLGGSLLAAAIGMSSASWALEPQPGPAPDTRLSVENYALPPIKLVRDDGKTVVLAEELDDGRPVLLNFIYTTCTTTCPVASHTFSSLQAKLGQDLNKVHMVSISIDPEQDTPARLADYAKKFKAGPQWRLYTGTMEASLAIQRAFNAYRGDKMNHPPVTFLRAAPGKPWVRLDGLATPSEVASEYRQLMASESAAR